MRRPRQPCPIPGPCRVIALTSSAIAVVAMTMPRRCRSEPITAEERAHWAFQPVRSGRRSGRQGSRAGSATRSTPSSWRGSRPAACSPSPEADRATLIRRLSFDLTGLPPTPEEVERVPERSLARRLRAARRSPAGQPAVRRALGAALARPGAVRRHRRLRVRPGPAQRLAVPRLGRREPESRHALRSVRPAPARRRRDRARRSPAPSSPPGSTAAIPTWST